MFQPFIESFSVLILALHLGKKYLVVGGNVVGGVIVVMITWPYRNTP